MVTINKISADFYDDTFKLIAIHCGLEGYAMAYHLNSVLGLKLSRREEKEEDDEDRDEWLESFSIYEWKDKIKEHYWTLVGNTVKEEQKSDALGLFSSEIAINTIHLVEERKEVDYFLKIEAEDDTLTRETIKKINLIPRVVTAYSLEATTLKSKRNLIF
ncbi:hypothetical protein MTsPCn9_16780 [Croceitalea sp. MTPC9]|uniref:IPExxxVDY family protein n=1 Tax=unclassified Croceitalea TaxID=2632280 RepID=UPI002B375719|nr:hypothetical protein MTsPCn6_09630 [Croceitalea sp. MTPC6]GMN16742.1 hypothetical protein MTsPCn9_16780 [Croceitalea sp. MTPC9]